MPSKIKQHGIKKRTVKKLYFATGNPNKFKEAQAILGFSLRQIKIDLAEIQALEIKEVVEAKARQAFREVGRPVLVEDSGIYINAWQGLPGALTKWFERALGNEGICHLMRGEKNRRVRAESVFGFFDGKKIHLFLGVLQGSVPRAPRGEHGFGWDAIFIPQGCQKTFAQMPMAEKNKISMRKKALVKLKRYLENFEF